MDDDVGIVTDDGAVDDVLPPFLCWYKVDFPVEIYSTSSLFLQVEHPVMPFSFANFFNSGSVSLFKVFKVLGCGGRVMTAAIMIIALTDSFNSFYYSQFPHLPLLWIL